MKVLDNSTGLMLESENDFVVAQWKANPERYAPEKPRAGKRQKAAASDND